MLPILQMKKLSEVLELVNAGVSVGAQMSTPCSLTNPLSFYPPNSPK